MAHHYTKPVSHAAKALLLKKGVFMPTNDIEHLNPCPCGNDKQWKFGIRIFECTSGYVECYACGRRGHKRQGKTFAAVHRIAKRTWNAGHIFMPKGERNANVQDV